MTQHFYLFFRQWCIAITGNHKIEYIVKKITTYDEFYCKDLLKKWLISDIHRYFLCFWETPISSQVPNFSNVTTQKVNFSLSF